MLVLDRDAARTKLVSAAIVAGATGAPGEELEGGGARLGIRWRRVLAGVFLGFACAAKWNGIWFLIVFVVMAIAWDLGARRALGYKGRLAGLFRSDVKWLPVTFLVVPLLSYTASWSGWFASSLGYDRHWAALNGNHVPIWSTIDSWYQYQRSMLGFGLGLTSHAGYVSEPWSWIYLGRPVSFFYAAPKGCGSSSCSQEVLAIGTPAIWWASMLALAFCIGWWISRRDWRAGAVLAGVGAGWLPWFWFALHDNRTEYYFYAVAFLPYLVIAITLCLGLIIGPVDAPPGRRAIGAAVTGAYLLLVLANFAYLYPVLTAQVLPYDFWRQRMWFNSWI
jgi:dolichyl-phosphate-mannose--protein O-mannosyl transferase